MYICAVMLKRTIAFLLILTLVSTHFSKIYVFAGFELNRNYIAEQLCINKNKPELNCHGKCFLMKKLEQAEKKQEAQGRDHRRGEVAAPQPGAYRLAGRAALFDQQEPCVERRPPDASRRILRRVARRFLEKLYGLGARSALAQPHFQAFGQGLEGAGRQGKGQDQGHSWPCA